MKKLVHGFLADENGATAIEYSLIACMLAAILLAAWPNFYDGFIAVWTDNGKVIREAVK